MKVLLYGEPLHPGTCIWSYHETLLEMGHEVVHCDSWEGMDHYWTKMLWRIWWKTTRRVIESHRRAHVARLLDMSRRTEPDVILVLKGMYVGPEDVRKLKRSGAWVIIINHDDFFSLNRANRSAAQRAAIPEWDHVFVTREVNVEEVAPLNPSVEFFQFAYHPSIHRPVPPAAGDGDKWRSDAVFVGTWEAERAALMEELVKRVDLDMAVWGGQWHKLSPWSPLRQHVRGGEIYLDDQCRAIGASKISLGFLRKKNRDKATMRTFEIPACGGLLLAERTSLHQRIYREGVEAEFFGANDPGELADKVRRLLAADERRLAIRDAGMVAVARGKHTYRDRLERILDLYESVGRKAREGRSAVG